LMHRVFRLLLLSALVALPALGFAQTNPLSGKIDPAKLKAKLLQGAYIEGHLVEVNEDEKRFSFQHINEVKKANKAEQAKYAALSARWNQALAMRTTSLEDLKKLQAECRAAYKTAFEIEQTPIDFELKGEKTLAVRTLLLPTDADGKVKKLTFAEQQNSRAILATPVTLPA
jgi:hypothetical protein